MLEENKNLKDPLTSIDTVVKDNSIFCAKTNKLVTALYMVTDIMEKEEPLRNKLRTLGVNIISDIHTISPLLDKERAGVRFLDEILSFLDIASAINLISEMNCNILKKEFIQLKQSLQENSRQDLTLSELFQDSSPLEGCPDLGRGGVDKFIPPPPKGYSSRGELNSIGHNGQTGFDTFKKQRRESILKIIKDKPDGMSIKDIVLTLHSFGEECGEKTLQRELVSMVGDGVLKKNGEKRWSRYFLANA